MSLTGSLSLRKGLSRTTLWGVHPSPRSERRAPARREPACVSTSRAGARRSGSLSLQHLQRSGTRRRREEAIQFGELRACQPMLEGAKILLEPLAAGGLRDDDDVVIGQKPGQGSLRRGHAVVRGEFAQL